MVALSTVLAVLAAGSDTLSPAANDPTVPPHFENVARQAGVEFTYFSDPRPGRFFLPEIMGGGAAWLDFDGDGHLDLYLVNGCLLPFDPNDQTHTNRLYRAQGDGRFAEVTRPARVGDNGYGQGASAGDFDNDGFVDLYVTNYGSSLLYQNSGDGTFSEVHREVEPVTPFPRWSTSSAWADLDGDGNLDLYVATYVETNLASNPACDYPKGRQDMRGYCGPDKYKGQPDVLYMNSGDGTFRDESRMLVTAKGGKGLGVIVADLDNDGWPDVYVANDMEENFLFHNVRTPPDSIANDASGSLGQPSGVPLGLREIGMLSGAALSGDGVAEASMGVTCADFDGNGWPDIFLTHFYHMKNTLYRNLGRMQFLDASAASQLVASSLDYNGFGTVSLDYDRDGWQDLFATNGHVLGPDLPPFAMKPQLWRNGGAGRFREVSRQAGPYFQEQWVGRGAAVADYDNDGDEDIAVISQYAPMAILRNDTAKDAHFLGLCLVGRSSNRSALNARVRVRLGNRVLLREVIGGGSYLSSSDPRLLVGLGSTDVPVSLELRWPSGLVQELRDLQPDQYWLVVEDETPRLLR